MPFVARWVSLQIVILSEVSQAQKNKYHLLLLMYGIWGGKKGTNELIYKAEVESQI